MHLGERLAFDTEGVAGEGAGSERALVHPLRRLDQPVVVTPPRLHDDAMGVQL